MFEMNENRTETEPTEPDTQSVGRALVERYDLHLHFAEDIKQALAVDTLAAAVSTAARLKAENDRLRKVLATLHNALKFELGDNLYLPPWKGWMRDAEEALQATPAPDASSPAPDGTEPPPPTVPPECAPDAPDPPVLDC
jgi:hypothetical protein